MYSIILHDGTEVRSAAPMTITALSPCTHTFTALYPQTPGNPPVQFTWPGKTPTDALLRQWATCLPETEMSGPLRCETDGHTYHLDLTDEGRQIKVVAEPVQFHVKTI